MNRFFFWLGCALAVALLALVLLSPILTRAQPTAPRWLRLFAEDPTLRRATIISGCGLLITACVLFRRPQSKQS